MNLFLTKLTFAVYVNGNQLPEEFDEQTRVIESTDLESAFFKARNIGKLQEEDFADCHEREIIWKFIDVSEVFNLGTFTDGDQIYSQTHKTDSNDTYITYIRQKSMEIQARSLTFA